MVVEKHRRSLDKFSKVILVDREYQSLTMFLSSRGTGMAFRFQLTPWEQAYGNTRQDRG